MNAQRKHDVRDCKGDDEDVGRTYFPKNVKIKAKIYNQTGRCMLRFIFFWNGIESDKIFENVFSIKEELNELNVYLRF